MIICVTTLYFYQIMKQSGLAEIIHSRFIKSIYGIMHCYTGI